ncbi:hypothetical protein Thimo_3575 [Thioflavicoccus mobilis 8321]|uniref:Spermidine synthase n=1 Tax=Thioflavicoccus mobilis 8321 TaxID=765912 RepID=L0H1W4_9GAMM|nr:hypothetical protein [Thioflavicoccus mobilis]AGA92231.1 hypothetical protein Thimo_3575 [Thioflavicoccus mobilis 8321]
MDDAATSQPIHQMMADMLGLPLFRTDLHLPDYPVGEIGPWRVTRCPLHTGRGYWGQSYVVADMPALLRRHGDRWETWMSMAPYELQSQELGCRYAYGHTVVMGLGMGWIAINAALNPTVEKVTVIERDPYVIALVKESGVLERAPVEAGRKIAVVQADALEWTPTEKVDFLYADIWLHIAEPQALEEVQRMQANLRAEAIYFWGQELVIREQAALLAPDALLDQVLLERVIRERICLPLAIPERGSYLELVHQALSLKTS